ncbi:MAG: prenyltransferase [Thermoanaerobaculales bacterium]|nr:prenyltransferase [Thermoanaerobaculales bacterium]
MTQTSAFFGVARAPFLILPITLVICGAGASSYDGSFSWLRTVVALIGLVALHMAVNIFNEVSDLRTGIDLETKATPFSGGSGTLPSGAMSPRTATVFGIICSLVGAGAGAFFLVKIGWPMVPLILVGAIVVLTYTDSLARVGLGETAAGLGLGALPVLGAALVQDGRLGAAAVAASLPAFFMTFNLLLLNEFPDEEADRRGGRRNLVLLCGRKTAARIYALAGFAVPAALVGAVAWGILPSVALIALIPSILLVGPLRWALGSADGDVPIPALGANVMWNLATNSVLGLSLAFAAGS